MYHVFTKLKECLQLYSYSIIKYFRVQSLYELRVLKPITCWYNSNIIQIFDVSHWPMVCNKLPANTATIIYCLKNVESSKCDQSSYTMLQHNGLSLMQNGLISNNKVLPF